MKHFLITITLLFFYSTLSEAKAIYTNEQYIMDLNKMVFEVDKTFPKQIDEITKLLSLKNKGLNLVYTYSIDFSNLEEDSDIKKALLLSREEFVRNITKSQRQMNITEGCSNKLFRTVFIRGGKIDYKYYWKDTNENTIITVTKKDCIDLDNTIQAIRENDVDKKELDIALKASLELLNKSLPIKISNEVSLVEAVYNDSFLHYKYSLDKQYIIKKFEKINKKPINKMQLIRLNDYYKKITKENTPTSICKNPQSLLFLKSGSSIKIDYSWNNGELLHSTLILPKNCNLDK